MYDPRMSAGFVQGAAISWLADLVEVPSETDDVESTARRIHAVLARNFRVEHLGIHVLEPDGSLSRVHGIAVETADGRIPAGDPLVARLRTSRRPFRISVDGPFDPGPQEALERAGVRVVTVVPLLLGEKVTGAITASRPDDDELTDLSDDILIAVGRVASVSLEQARLLAAARVRAERDRLLHEAARFARDSADVSAVLRKYSETIARLAGARRAAMTLPSAEDPHRYELRATHGFTPEDELLFRSIHRPAELLLKKAEQRRPVAYGIDEVGLPEIAQFYRERGEVHIACVPLVHQDVVVGVAFMSRATPFDPEVLAALERVGHEVAATIASMVEREASRRWGERKELEARLRGALRDSFDLPKILSSAAESLGVLLQVDLSGIVLPDPEKPGYLKVAYAWRKGAGAISYEISFDAYHEGDVGFIADDPLVVEDTERDERVREHPSVAAAGVRAFVWIRFSRGADKGGLAVATLETPRRWTEDDVKTIQAVAELCQIAIARAEIFEKARQSAVELELLVAHMADPVVMVNDKLDIVRMNPAARAFLWKRTDTPPPGEVDAWNPHVTVLDWDGNPVPMERWPIVRAVVYGEVTREAEYVFRWTDDGREAYLIINASPLRDGDGKLRGGVIILRDVTERRAAAAAAQRTEKLRVLGELAAGVAHDLNNTLAAVLGRAEMIAATAMTPDTRTDAELIASAARDAAVVLARLTRLSQKTHAAAPRAVLDLARIAADAVELTRPRWSVDAARAGREIKVVIRAPEPVQVHGVGAELREVITNLILNAVDALPSGGVIRITVGRERGQAFFEVEDDGIGMPPDVLRHAFEPFFTTKGELGTGLGLSISAAIVAGHGGRMDARSTPGKGTSIRAWLTHAEEEPTPYPPATGPKALRLLVVDDDARVRSVLADLLTADGHLVETAASGEDALSALERAARLPDLVVTDVAMPGMSGWMLAEEVRRKAPHMGIILVSGWAATSAAETLAALRATFVMKPFRAEEIRQAVATALREGARR
jgi:signal transduction histidine kinase/CheY-like chemotaxis protein/GAF domain-containing protein